MFGYVKKKDYDLLEKYYKNISDQAFGMRVMLVLYNEFKSVPFSSIFFLKSLRGFLL